MEIKSKLLTTSILRRFLTEVCCAFIALKPLSQVAVDTGSTDSLQIKFLRVGETNFLVILYSLNSDNTSARGVRIF